MQPPVAVEAVRREAVPGVDVLVVSAPVDPVPARVAVAPPVAGSAAGGESAARIGDNAGLRGDNDVLTVGPAAPMASTAVPVRGVSRIDPIGSKSVSPARGVLPIDAPPVMSDP